MSFSEPMLYYAAQSMLVTVVALAAGVVFWGAQDGPAMEYALITMMSSLVVGVMFGLLGLKEEHAAGCKSNRARPENSFRRSERDR